MATVLMDMGDDVSVTAEMSYASPVEHDRFPETYVVIECENGTIELGPDYWVRVTTRGQGTLARRYAPPRYAWADPQYDLVHASIVDCNANLLHAMQTGTTAETSGDDNLKTVRLVYAAYDSAASGKVITFA